MNPVTSEVICVVPVDPFWYVNQVYNEEIKSIEKKYKVQMSAQVNVTFQADQEGGSPPDALSEFLELIKKSSAESCGSHIPLKFVDPDQWSDAFRLLQKSEKRLLLTLTPEEVTAFGPTCSQDAFSDVINGMQKATSHLKQSKMKAEATPSKIDKNRKDLLAARRSRLGVMASKQKITSSYAANFSGGKEFCSICLLPLTEKKRLKCQHEFCEECLQDALKLTGSICPLCNHVFDVLIGDQPDGNMSWTKSSHSLPGFSGCGHIIITYSFPSGVQTERHPNPGKPFNGTSRTAYLPDNKEGNAVLKLLKKAFDQRLIFTVGNSKAIGLKNQVVWSDISHKTSLSGGVQKFGYPDFNYLERVKKELRAKGIEES
ncbi:E3 ubiquitin-protein ligase DTX3L [Oryzias melastigma]|uniref:E3 ubiquitin-protein ligase n=1 Tax=Oryzias melastigma TaxID=30732 RepID=A0A834F5X1_ORYME|nr:E3 ubiquitin-protein ligase DTX3L [Oryzias melastigma]